MKKVGILGGSFNPIHNGHIQLGLSAYKEFNLDKVIFIPSGISYFKKDITMIDGQMRKHMVDLAIKGYDFFVSSDIEINRPGNTYTIDTIRSLLDEYKDTEFFFIAGADTMYSIKDWYMAEELFKMTTFIFSVRNDCDHSSLEEQALYLKKKYDAKIHLLSDDNFEVSSTQIREHIKDSEYIKPLIPTDVYKYIIENEIYF